MIVVQMRTYMDQFLFGRFVSLVGQVALCQVTYLEGDILQELKRRRQPNKDQVLFSFYATRFKSDEQDQMSL